MQRRLRELLDLAPPGPIRVISMCAGEGRDLLGVLPEHPRRSDVTGVLVEIDHEIATRAREGVAHAGLQQLQVVEADGAVSDAYARHVPADVVLACGIFGNISEADLERTVRNLSMLGHTGTTLIWTRHRLEPDLTPRIRQWFGESGCTELSFDSLDNEKQYGIGVVRVTGTPVPFRRGTRFFTFLR